MSFLSIPSQEGLFTTIKTNRSADEAEGRTRSDADNNDDDDEDEDDDTDVRLIPRCSPVPRKRGASIFDETAEYMRIHLALAAGKRVSFADTTGGDLVDVREFVAFDSDEEADSERWEQEEAKYRKPEREPTYNVHPEFHAPTGGALLRAVRTNKVEVERVSPVEDDPLAFSGIIRVLNISFNKAVYIRSTMDSWATYFDYPAEYVQGSNDGGTDQFTFKLSFAPPYNTHGSRIEFVVRYETSDGDYWANNSSMNYVVTLLLSYEDDTVDTNIDVAERRSILKPPKVYSLDDELASDDEQEKEQEEQGTSESGLARPVPVCPVIIQPEIDVEIAVHPSGSSVTTNLQSPSVDGTLSAHTIFPGEQFPRASPETTLLTNAASVLCASESVQPNTSEPLPRLQCELCSHIAEQPIRSSPSALLSASIPSPQESTKRSDNSQAEREETLAPEASHMGDPAAEMNLLSTAGEDGSTQLELPAEWISCPSGTQDLEQEVAVGSSELVERLSEGPMRSTAHFEGSAPVPSSPVAETQASVKAENGAPSSPELTESTSVSTDSTKVSQNVDPQSVSAWEETGTAPHISSEISLESAPNVLPEVSEPQSERDTGRNLMPCVYFLSGVVSLSIVMQEPSALFLIGLLMVLRRL